MENDIPFYETLSLTLIGNMGRVHRLCREVVTLAVEPLGLTQPRWTTLLHVHMLSEGITQLELAASLGIEMPSLTRTLKQLEEQSLIIRLIDQQDKRSKKIYFTDQGRLVLEALEEKIIDIQTQLYSGLTHEQLNAMAYGLIKMEENAQYCIHNNCEKGIK